MSTDPVFEELLRKEYAAVVTASGVQPATVKRHCFCLDIFLGWLPPTAARLWSLSEVQVQDFLVAYAADHGFACRKHIHIMLRRFLAFAHGRRLIERQLAAAVFSLRCYRLSAVPRPISEQHIEGLLCSIDQRTAAGCRDYVIIQLLRIYGPRAVQLCHLCLEDIDWDNDTISFSAAKHGHRIMAPLLPEAGNSILAYLTCFRPHSPHRELLLSVTEPSHPLRASTIGSRVRGCVARAGIILDEGVRPGSHAFRYACATRMLAAGNTAKVLADCLGHKCMDSVQVYNKLDSNALQAIPLPWPLQAASQAASITYRYGNEAPASATTPILPKDGLTSRRRHRRCTGGSGFQSVFANSMHAFIAFKQAGGFAYTGGRKSLRDVDAFLCDAQVESPVLSDSLISAYRISIASLASATRYNRMCVLRDFSSFHHQRHPESLVINEIGVRKKPRIRFVVLSEVEMTTLLQAVDSTTHRTVPASSIRCLLALLYCCGLRIGEALGLTVADFDTAVGTLHIRYGKFRKQRIIPLHDSVRQALCSALAERRLPAEIASSTPLCATRCNKALTHNQIYKIFRHLQLKTGLAELHGTVRLHDLRHSFAATVLRRTALGNGDVYELLPKLATFMGHVCFSSTQIYLHVDAQYLAHAAEKFRLNYLSNNEKGALS